MQGVRTHSVLDDSEVTTSFLILKALHQTYRRIMTLSSSPNTSDRGVGQTCATGLLRGCLCPKKMFFWREYSSEGTDCNENPFVAKRPTAAVSSDCRLPTGYISHHHDGFRGALCHWGQGNREIGLESESTKVCLPTDAAGLAVCRAYDHVEDF